MSDGTSAAIIGNTLYEIDDWREQAIADQAKFDPAGDEANVRSWSYHEGRKDVCTALFRKVFKQGRDYDFSWDQAVEDDLLAKYDLVRLVWGEKWKEWEIVYFGYRGFKKAHAWAKVDQEKPLEEQDWYVKEAS